VFASAKAARGFTTAGVGAMSFVFYMLILDYCGGSAAIDAFEHAIERHSNEMGVAIGVFLLGISAYLFKQVGQELYGNLANHRKGIGMAWKAQAANAACE
jgi:hypothetical protein